MSDNFELDDPQFELDEPPKSLGEKALGYGLRTLENAPGSAKRFAESTYQAFVHPIQTGQQLGEIVKRDPYAIPRMYVERYGGLENIKKTFEKDPIGVLADASLFLTGGETALGRIPGAAGEVARTAGALGRGIDPLGQTANLAGGLAKQGGELAAEATGLRTGVGAEPIKTAASSGFESAGFGQAGSTFRKDLRTSDPMGAMKETVEQAKEGVSELAKERQAEYQKGMVDVRGDRKVLNFAPIDKAVKDIGEVQTFTGPTTGVKVNIDPETSQIRAKLQSTVDDWKQLNPKDFHTAEGLDALKRKLGNIREATDQGTPARRVADQVYQSVRKEIIKQVPTYAKTMEAYEESSNLINELRRALSLNDRASIDTTIRKLQSTMRNNVNASWGYRQGLAELLDEKAPGLMERLAGQSLAQWAPRGQARMMTSGELGGAGILALLNHPHLAMILAGDLAWQSPRLVGEAVHAGGRIAGAVTAPYRAARDIAAKVGITPRGVGAAAFQAGRAVQGEPKVEARTQQLRTLIHPDVYDRINSKPATQVALKQWQSSPNKTTTRNLAYAIARELKTPKLVPRIEQEIGAIQ